MASKIYDFITKNDPELLELNDIKKFTEKGLLTACKNASSPVHIQMETDASNALLPKLEALCADMSDEDINILHGGLRFNYMVSRMGGSEFTPHVISGGALSIENYHRNLIPDTFGCKYLELDAKKMIASIKKIIKALKRTDGVWNYFVQNKGNCEIVKTLEPELDLIFNGQTLLVTNDKSILSGTIFEDDRVDSVFEASRGAIILRFYKTGANALPLNRGSDDLDILLYNYSTELSELDETGSYFDTDEIEWVIKDAIENDCNFMPYDFSLSEEFKSRFLIPNMCDGYDSYAGEVFIRARSVLQVFKEDETTPVRYCGGSLLYDAIDTYVSDIGESHYALTLQYGLSYPAAQVYNTLISMAENNDGDARTAIFYSDKKNLVKTSNLKDFKKILLRLEKDIPQDELSDFWCDRSITLVFKMASLSSSVYSASRSAIDADAALSLYIPHLGLMQGFENDGQFDTGNADLFGIDEDALADDESDDDCD